MLYGLSRSTLPVDPIDQEKGRFRLPKPFTKSTGELFSLRNHPTLHLNRLRQVKEGVVLWTVLISSS